MAIPEITGDLLGANALEANLLELAEEYGPRQARTSLRVPLRRVFRPVADAIRENTPVDTGVLAARTRLRIVNPQSRGENKPEGTVLVARAGWEFPYAQNTIFQALAVEFGTASRPPDRVLRGALESHAAAIFSDIGPEIGRGIENTARRLYRKRQAATARR